MSAKLSADPGNFQALTFLIWTLEDLQKGISSSGQRREREKREERKGKEKEKKKNEMFGCCFGAKAVQNVEST